MIIIIVVFIITIIIIVILRWDRTQIFFQIVTYMIFIEAWWRIFKDAYVSVNWVIIG